MKHGGADAGSQTSGLGSHGSDGSSADRRREGCGGQHMRVAGVEEKSAHRIEAPVVLGCDAVSVHARAELRSAALEDAASRKQLPRWWCQERCSRKTIGLPGHGNGLRPFVAEEFGALPGQLLGRDGEVKVRESSGEGGEQNL